MEYLDSAVVVIAFKPFVRPLPRTKTYFFLLPAFVDELLSSQKIITI